jgi:hypothetical protein
MAGQCLTHRRRLKRIHGLTDRRRASQNCGNEPFPLIMPAEETIQLRLVTGLADKEQQMPLFRFTGFP